MQKQIAVKKLEKLIYTETKERNRRKIQQLRKMILGIYFEKMKKKRAMYHFII
jgi:hypothetical protein